MEKLKCVKVAFTAMLLMILAGTVSYLAVILVFGFEIFDYFRKSFNQPELYSANFWNFWAALFIYQVLNIIGFNTGFNRLFPLSKCSPEEVQELSSMKFAMMAGLCLGTLMLILLRPDTGFYNLAE